MIPTYAALLVAILTGAQEKPVAPVVPFQQILACVEAANCKNMTKATMWWYDVAKIPVLTFQDDGWTYSLNSDTRGVRVQSPLRIYLTAPGEQRPSHSLSLNPAGQLHSAELGPQPGDSPPGRSTPEDRTTWLQRHKVVGGSGSFSGEEFKPYWQKLADQALAAIARTLARDPQAQEKPAISFDQIVACAKTLDCRNMTKSSVTWFDQVGIPVIAFSDDSGGYAFAASRREDRVVSIWITLPGQGRPSQLLSVGPEDIVLTGELGPMPGDGPQAGRKTPEEMAQWGIRHKAFISPARSANPGRIPPQGAEFKTFWEGQAAQALAAIRRQISK